MKVLQNSVVLGECWTLYCIPLHCIVFHCIALCCITGAATI